MTPRVHQRRRGVQQNGHGVGLIQCRTRVSNKRAGERHRVHCTATASKRSQGNRPQDRIHGKFCAHGRGGDARGSRDVRQHNAVWSGAKPVAALHKRSRRPATHAYDSVRADRVWLCKDTTHDQHVEVTRVLQRDGAGSQKAPRMRQATT